MDHNQLLNWLLPAAGLVAIAVIGYDVHSDRRREAAVARAPVFAETSLFFAVQTAFSRANHAWLGQLLTERFYDTLPATLERTTESVELINSQVMKRPNPEEHRAVLYTLRVGGTTVVQEWSFLLEDDQWRLDSINGVATE